MIHLDKETKHTWDKVFKLMAYAAIACGLFVLLAFVNKAVFHRNNLDEAALWAIFIAVVVALPCCIWFAIAPLSDCAQRWMAKHQLSEPSNNSEQSEPIPTSEDTQGNKSAVESGTEDVPPTLEQEDSIPKENDENKEIPKIDDSVKDDEILAANGIMLEGYLDTYPARKVLGRALKRGDITVRGGFLKRKVTKVQLAYTLHRIYCQKKGARFPEKELDLLFGESKLKQAWEQFNSGFQTASWVKSADELFD
jgi:hypothetical protein